MRFKGQLLLPSEQGPGLPVDLEVADHHLALVSEREELGAWPLEAISARRLRGDTFAITVAGSWTDTGAGVFNEGTGKVTFDGTGTVNSNEPFNNVTVNSGGTVTLGRALDVNANLVLTAGTLDVSGSSFGIAIAGNWTDTGLW